MTFNDYKSAVWVDSQLAPGVRFLVDRLSFGRRLELMKSVRELTLALDFHQTGSESDNMAVAILSARIDQLYVKWGVREIEGMSIDGLDATADALALNGPEEVFLEALAAVKREFRLSTEEKKT